MYCRKRAGSKEHIIATQFIQVLKEDPRALPVPIRLNVTLPDGAKRTIVGRSKRPTLEYTTKVCHDCNSGWMNDIDLAAYPYVARMIRGEELTMDDAIRGAVAAWICKVAVTARSEPHNPLPLEKAWTDWLYEKHTALPAWHVWIGRYDGDHPWFYRPHDVRIELGPGSALPAPGTDFLRSNGVYAALVVGYLIAQVFGISGTGWMPDPDREFQVLPMIWPTTRLRTWPPREFVGDNAVMQWADRLIHDPAASQPSAP
jgi:hypothetical protein